MDKQQSKQFPNIPAFTLYRLNSQQLKTCYQSKDTKIICCIAGPYYPRTSNQSSNMLGSGGCLSLSNLQPVLNISISLPNFIHISTSKSDEIQQIFNANDDPQQQVNLHSSKINKTILFLKTSLKQIFSQCILSRDYQRMVFDISLTVVEINLPKRLNKSQKQIQYKLQESLIPQMLLTKMANLLCYTMLLANIQIKYTFSGVLIVYNSQTNKLHWIESQSSSLDLKSDNVKNLLCLSVVFDHRDKQLLFSHWNGTYSFYHYQRILNYCQNACEQMNELIIKKIENIQKQQTKSQIAKNKQI